MSFATRKLREEMARGIDEFAKPGWRSARIKSRVQRVASGVWAKAVAQLPGAAVPVPGFGLSDGACQAHLFWFAQSPSARKPPQCLQTKVRVGP